MTSILFSFWYVANNPYHRVSIPLAFIIQSYYTHNGIPITFHRWKMRSKFLRHTQYIPATCTCTCIRFKYHSTQGTDYKCTTESEWNSYYIQEVLRTPSYPCVFVYKYPCSIDSKSISNEGSYRVLYLCTCATHNYIQWVRENPMLHTKVIHTDHDSNVIVYP